MKPLALLALALCAGAQAQTTPWQLGAVLDLTHSTRSLATGLRDQGLQLGHSDLSASGPLGPWLRGQLGAAFATHEGRLEKGFEEVYVETTALPSFLPQGLQLRLGRFASQIGYLNPQHQHADDFSERPLLYRSFFGGHWNDDGLRLNLTLPTERYWMLGAEAFSGRRLLADSANPGRRPGALTLVSKIGDDFGREHSWQLGLSYLHNRRQAASEAEPGEGHEHAASFSGRSTWLVDATWKWAPNGNNREQQLRLTLEAARIREPLRHQAQSLALVWRFDPSWELGARADWLRVSHAEGGEVHTGRLREQSLMLAWKPGHLQTLRLQLTRQRDALEFENPSPRSVFLQYVIAFGAHGAHSF